MLWVRCKQVHEAISFAAALPLPAVEDGGAGDDGARGDEGARGDGGARDLSQILGNELKD
jgi:hypothetical protein